MRTTLPTSIRTDPCERLNSEIIQREKKKSIGVVVPVQMPFFKNIAGASGGATMLSSLVAASKGFQRYTSNQFGSGGGGAHDTMQSQQQMKRVIECSTDRG